MWHEIDPISILLGLIQRYECEKHCYTLISMSEHYRTYAIAKHDYTGEGSELLSFKKGQKILLFAFNKGAYQIIVLILRAA